jgi:sigma-B regulation protein RsbU (phosphoserine phosphatase)
MASCCGPGPALGARRFAAIAAGETHSHIIAFDVAPEMSRDDVLFSLNIIRYSMNQRLRAERYESLIVEAQRIQQSILPQRVPQYAGFDIWGKTVPAEVVSGDFYDFIPISDNILGLAIADGSGHGLPAALVVRDIYMGLRMAMDRDFKIIRTMDVVISAGISGRDVVVRRLIRQLILWHRTPVIVIRQIAGDRRQPGSKTPAFPQC